MTSKMGPAAREDVQAKLRQRQKTKDQQLAEDVRAVLSTEAGRRVWMAIMRDANHDGPSFAGGDSGFRDYNEGKRSIGIQVRTLAERHPALNEAMWLEYWAQQREDELLRTAAVSSKPPEDE